MLANSDRYPTNNLHIGDLVPNTRSALPQIGKFDAGGGIDPTTGAGGMPPIGQGMNPMQQGMVAQYARLPTEKLQEMASRTAGSAQGQLVQKILQQRQMQPQQTAQQPAPQLAQRGGGIAARASGGDMGISPSQGDPWWTRSEASGLNHGATGFLHGTTAGRADAIQTQAPSGAYVLPADVVAGLGEGNSLAGARIIQQAISTGPHGTPLPHGGGGARLPHANAPQMAAHGGGIADAAPPANPVPVMLSHGEFVVPPEAVQRIGGGDLHHGHRVLDKFVETQRANQIKRLKSLPGPVKSKS